MRGMTFATTALACLLTMTPALADSIKLGSFDIKVDHFPDREKPDGETVAGFFTVTSAELEGVSASGQTIDVALMDYAHMMNWKGFSEGLDQLTTTPQVCGALSSALRKGDVYLLKFKSLKGFEFQGSTKFLGDQWSFENDEVIQVGFLDTSPTNKQVITVRYGCADESFDEH